MKRLDYSLPRGKHISIVDDSNRVERFRKINKLRTIYRQWKGKIMTNKEIQFLDDFYILSKKKLKSKYQLTELQFTEMCEKCRVSKVGRKWTKKDTEYLFAHIKSESYADIARALKMNIFTIKNRASRYGLKKDSSPKDGKPIKFIKNNEKSDYVKCIWWLTGDEPEKIAKTYHTSVSEIKSANASGIQCT